jgi:hypothetical protein
MKKSAIFVNIVLWVEQWPGTFNLKWWEVQTGFFRKNKKEADNERSSMNLVKTSLKTSFANILTHRTISPIVKAIAY